MEDIMKIEIKKVLLPSLISSIILFVLGLLLFFKSEVTLMSISYIIGGVLFALGVMAIVRFMTRENNDVFTQLNIVYGVICILGGVFFIKEPELIGSLMPIFLGIAIIINSSLKIQQALMLRNMKSQYWIGSFVTALLCLLCGVVLLFNPFKGAVIITKIIGLFLIIYAILDVVNSFILKKSSAVSIEIGPVSETKRHKRSKVKDATIVKEVDKEQEE